MRNLLALALVAALTACGGGGSNPLPNPGPKPTITPVAQNSVRITWTGAAHAATPQSVTRGSVATTIMPMSVTGTEPVVTGYDPSACTDSSPGSCTSVGIDSTAFPANISVQEVNAQGTPLPGTPTMAVATPAPVLVNLVPSPAPTTGPTPTPGPANYLVHAEGTGKTTATATFTDGASGSIPILAYTFFGVTCGYSAQDLPGAAVVKQGNAFVSASSTTADFYLTGPECPAPFNTGTALTLNMPHGYMALASTTSAASIATALPFTNQGTSIEVSAFATSMQVLIVQNGDGTYTKLRIGQTRCGWKTADQTLCDDNGFVAGAAAFSDSSGVFAL